MIKIMMLYLCCLSFGAVALDAPFWQPAGKGHVYIPQPRPEQFILDTHDAQLTEVTTYTGLPSFKVSDRKPHLTFYPCSQCHIYWETNPEPRKLAPVHEVGLEYGQGRLWCLDCHARDDRDRLRTLKDDPVDFDDAWQVCGQCHATRQKDWNFGAHGKRVYAWQGEAERYNCTHCHDPHRPRFTSRKPQAKPSVRAGLHPMPLKKAKQAPLWERKLSQAVEGKNDE